MKLWVAQTISRGSRGGSIRSMLRRIRRDGRVGPAGVAEDGPLLEQGPAEEMAVAVAAVDRRPPG